jgi:excinuclease ABC subunit A
MSIAEKTSNDLIPIKQEAEVINLRDMGRLVVKGARQHNLKNVNLSIKKNSLTVFTGCSGSGKSSLVFDTIYAEAQRRYIESLSPYARQFIGMMDKPDLDSITGLSPAVSIDQRTTSKNPRSTVGTTTEIYDYLRLLYARIGVPHSPATGLPIRSQTTSEMIEEVQKIPSGIKFNILSPVIRSQKGEWKKMLISLRRQGYQRAKLNGQMVDLEDIIELDKTKKHNLDIVIDRIEMEDGVRERIPGSIETAVKLSEGLMIIEIVEANPTDFKLLNHAITNGALINFSEKFCCPESGFTIEEMEPRIFSFNSPYGACPSCNGLGTEYYFVPELIVPDPTLSIREGAIAPFKEITNGKMQGVILEALSKHYEFSLDEPFETLPENIRNIIFNGTKGEKITVDITDGVRKVKVSQEFNGVIHFLSEKWKELENSQFKDELERFQDVTKCHVCTGMRLKQSSLCVKINGLSIGEVCSFNIEKSIEWFSNLPKYLNDSHKKIATPALKEILKRLEFLQNVGLSYLSLSRESGTLSGGESQRIRLASQIGSELTGVIYVLDEPSIGLHQSDNEKLIQTLKKLKDLGNTVLVVEHDEETMMHSDYLIDIGPGAGVNGGEIIAQGTPEEIMNNPNSVTGRFLSGAETIWDQQHHRPLTERKIAIRGAKLNNLKNVDIDIPLDVFVVVTGVSGCGKSSLIIKTLFKTIQYKIYLSQEKSAALFKSIKGLEHIDKIIQIDQSPIGRTPRSNPATYTACFIPIRDVFANLPESRKRGYKQSRFSFNVKGGRCESCQGDGMVKVEMHFLADVYVICDTCKGKRYNNETLEIKYKGKSISDVLEMPIDKALELFKKIPTIADKLQCLSDVGLGYMKLGQSATTLSGGESQRIKLARELSKRATGNILYILDEPTTGLHFVDIKKLLIVLHRLVDQGNSMIIIEHNMDVIRTADHIIDMGPKGGDEGGMVVVQGRPEDVAKCKESLTGKFLKKYIKSKKK